jgi:hypothetical protein
MFSARAAASFMWLSTAQAFRPPEFATGLAVADELARHLRLTHREP